MKTRKQKNHIGPGKKIVSIYLDQTEHVEFQGRADELHMSFSQYVSQLVRREIKKSRAGEPFVIERDNAGHVKTQPQ